MQTPKTRNYGGYTYSAVPVQEEDSLLTTEKGSSWDTDTKTRIAICVAGLIVVAAACVAAAILWNNFYGAYKLQTTVIFAKVGVGALLGVAALIGFSLVIAGTIGTSKNVGTHRDAPREQWGDASEKQPLLGEKGRAARRNGVADIYDMHSATTEMSGIIPGQQYIANRDVMPTEGTDSVQILTANSGQSPKPRVSVHVQRAVVTIDGDVEKVVFDTPRMKGGGKSRYDWEVDDDCLNSHTCMCR